MFHVFFYDYINNQFYIIILLCCIFLIKIIKDTGILISIEKKKALSMKIGEMHSIGKKKKIEYDTIE